MTLDPTNALLWSTVLPTKLDSYRVFLSNLTPGWPRLTPAWPLIHQCTEIRSVVLLSDLVAVGHSWAIWLLGPGWRQLTSPWNLTPGIHYTLIRAPSHRLWWLQSTSKLCFLDDLWPLVGSLPKVDHEPQSPMPYHPTKFQIDADTLTAPTKLVFNVI